MNRLIVLFSSSSLPFRNPRKIKGHRIGEFLRIPSPMSWACKKCTFVNPPPQKSECEICLTPSSPLGASSSSSSSPKWSCRACTFLNPYKNPNCEVCGTRCSVLSLSNFNDLNDTTDHDSSVGSVFYPLRPCNKRKVVDSIHIDDDEDSSEPSEKVEPSSKAINLTENKNIDSENAFSSFKILSYNVWFREDLELHKRMKAIADLVQLHSPDFICFQVSLFIVNTLFFSFVVL
ncbi:uncharacterized protein LOC113846286 [Abrus precatorius]|uniref:Uncharacterized protein LOC113846286 n=1 Tax=Abrus precatorius TaxID=3816 RepID=A0A8B8JFG0_ABRPR|nr:uncharacterized protein LOC113846286 [Abrus precatorius]